LRAVFKQKTLREWMEIFAGSDACVEPVLSLSEALDSDLARFRGIVKNMRLPSGCELRQIASPFPEARKGELSLPKESTYEVLLALGYREEEIDSLTEEGVLI
jgi:crotonobetainyl-CoA:carnitine CoA-transferase CaiB-like acyl-CoA transferase